MSAGAMSADRSADPGGLTAGNVNLFQIYRQRAAKAFAVRVAHVGRVDFCAPQTLVGDTSGPKA